MDVIALRMFNKLVKYFSLIAHAKAARSDGALANFPWHNAVRWSEKILDAIVTKTEVKVIAQFIK